MYISHALSRLPIPLPMLYPVICCLSPLPYYRPPSPFLPSSSPSPCPLFGLPFPPRPLHVIQMAGCGGPPILFYRFSLSLSLHSL